MVMLIVKWTLLGLVVIALAALFAGRMGWLQGNPPTGLGVHDGRLLPPSKTRNSVSSQAALYPQNPMHDEAAIAPLPLRGDAATTLAKIETVIAAIDGGRVVKAEPGYVYAQFTSRLMRYVDDVEFWFDPAANVVQVRSASRVGQEDLGVNRARIEAIRARLLAS